MSFTFQMMAYVTGGLSSETRAQNVDIVEGDADLGGGQEAEEVRGVRAHVTGTKKVITCFIKF